MDRCVILLAGTISLAACASTGTERSDVAEARQVAQQAIAAVKAGEADLIAVTGPIEDPSGRVRGRGQVVTDPDGAGLIVRIALRDFKPGSYGVHVHSVG